MVQSRRSILLTKYDWTLNAVQGGLSYSSGGTTGDGVWEITTTETYQKGLNIVNDMAFYIDGGSIANINSAANKVLVTKEWVNSVIAGGTITANSGLTKTLNNIQLGGPLVQTTNIDGNSHDLNFGSPSSRLANASIVASSQISMQSLFGTDSGQLVVSTIGTNAGFNGTTIFGNRGVASMGVAGNGVLLYTQPTFPSIGITNYFRMTIRDMTVTNNGTNNRFVIQDDAHLKGMVYWGDYSANFTPESLVSKRYVDNAISGGTPALSSVLAIGNTTGAHNISINTSQAIVSGNGGGQLNLDYGSDANVVVLSNDSGALTSTWLQLSSGQSGIFWNDGATKTGFNILDSVNGAYMQIADGSTTSLVKASYDGVHLATSTYDGYIHINLTSTGQTLGDLSSNNYGVIEDTFAGKGLQYADSYEANFTNYSLVTKKYVDSKVSIISPDDKFLVANDVIADFGLATSSTISHTPVNGCYVAVFFNGQELEVGNGVRTKAFYFSGDGGANARGFSTSHPNGQVQAGDSLYFNPSIAEFTLSAGQRISLMYMVYSG